MFNMEKDLKKRGRKSRASGKRFEIEVRKDLEKRGYIVCKWTNTVDFQGNKLIQAKSKYNPFLKKIVSEGAGFPDHLAMRRLTQKGMYMVIGVEAKKRKYLDAMEKRMAAWLLDNNIFLKIYVAYPVKEGREKKIIYKKFEKKEKNDKKQ